MIQIFLASDLTTAHGESKISFSTSPKSGWLNTLGGDVQLLRKYTGMILDTCLNQVTDSMHISVRFISYKIIATASRSVFYLFF